jgi:hypothetical protein
MPATIVMSSICKLVERQMLTLASLANRHSSLWITEAISVTNCFFLEPLIDYTV